MNKIPILKDILSACLQLCAKLFIINSLWNCWTMDLLWVGKLLNSLSLSPRGSKRVGLGYVIALQPDVCCMRSPWGDELMDEVYRNPWPIQIEMNTMVSTSGIYHIPWVCCRGGQPSPRSLVHSESLSVVIFVFPLSFVGLFSS